MAERGIIPKFMGTRNSHGTPTYGILLSASGILVLCWLSFSEVIEMLNILYCIAQLIEFAAFVYLRIKMPDLDRPFKIPLGTVGVTAMLIVPAVFAVIIIAISSKLAFLTAIVTVLVSLALYALLEVMKERQWMEFKNEFEGAYEGEGEAKGGAGDEEDKGGTVGTRGERVSEKTKLLGGV